MTRRARNRRWQQLPQHIRADLTAVQQRDPAARSKAEVFFLYNGVHAVWTYRITNQLWRLGLRFVPRLLSQFAKFLTGVEIHPAATIGKRLVIDHGTGVVIGATAEVGDDVLLFHGVTLGGTGHDTGKRHPTIGDRVVIGAGAKVLGNITIGADSAIGANAVVVRDAPEWTTLVGIPAKARPRRGNPQSELPDQADFYVI